MQQLDNTTDVEGGLRPTEVRLPAGCIQETDANYKGDAVSGVLNGTMSGDACCQHCRCTPAFRGLRWEFDQVVVVRPLGYKILGLHGSKQWIGLAYRLTLHPELLAINV